MWIIIFSKLGYKKSSKHQQSHPKQANLEIETSIPTTYWYGNKLYFQLISNPTYKNKLSELSTHIIS